MDALSTFNRLWVCICRNNSADPTQQATVFDLGHLLGLTDKQTREHLSVLESLGYIQSEGSQISATPLGVMEAEGIHLLQLQEMKATVCKAAYAKCKADSNQIVDLTDTVNKWALNELELREFINQMVMEHKITFLPSLHYFRIKLRPEGVKLAKKELGESPKLSSDTQLEYSRSTMESLTGYEERLLNIVCEMILPDSHKLFDVRLAAQSSGLAGRDFENAVEGLVTKGYFELDEFNHRMRLTRDGREHARTYEAVRREKYNAILSRVSGSPKVFISHSSKDKIFAERLAKSLKEAGFSPWIDSEAIKAGQSIPGMIQRGLAEAEYVVLLLSKHSVESKWVETEWMTKYWEQVEAGRVMVIPAMINECQCPRILSQHKYANFMLSYELGLFELIDGMTPFSTPKSHEFPTWVSPQAASIAVLLEKLHSQDVSLSRCLAEGFTLATKIPSTKLMQFCRDEISGIQTPAAAPNEESTNGPSWRTLELFATTQELNPSYVGFDTAESLYQFIKAHPSQFTPVKMVLAQPVATLEHWLEGRSNKSTAMVLTCKASNFDANAKYPDMPVYVYGRPDAISTVLGAIKQEFIKQLLALLPSGGTVHEGK